MQQEISPPTHLSNLKSHNSWLYLSGTNTAGRNGFYLKYVTLGEPFLQFGGDKFNKIELAFLLCVIYSGIITQV